MRTASTTASTARTAAGRPARRPPRRPGVLPGVRPGVRPAVLLPAVLLTTVLLTTVLTACAGPAADAGAGASPGPTRLVVVVADGQGASSRWSLTCDPAGGDHPDPVAACAALDGRGADALPDPPPDTACTMIYGGPQTATVTGTWRGRAVEAALDRTDGCGIGRWEALVGLLPEPSGTR